MQQVAEGQRWRQSGGRIYRIRGIQGAMAQLQAVTGAEEGAGTGPMIAVASLAAGDGGWHLMPTVAELMDQHAISELAARRILNGEELFAAKRAAAFFKEVEWPEDVRDTEHWLDAYYEYAATLAPNADAIAYIVDEARNRIARDHPANATEEAVERILENAPELTGVDKTIKELREAHDFLRDNGGAAIREAVNIFPRVLDLLEAASEHLDERNGPVVDLWRCDDCGNFIPDDFNGRSWNTDTLRFLRVQINAHTELDGDDGVVVQPICLNHPDGEDGRAMRHVRCRVTADDPDFKAAPDVPEVVES